jgi:hypothetical protein
MKRIAILQSNYIPWKGYFDLISSVDEFVLYDDMQFTKNDWRNRNKIKTPNGVEWLSVPVGQDIRRRIRDVVILDGHWQRKHWRSLEANYRRARYFDEISSWLSPLYLDMKFSSLSELNMVFIKSVTDYLGIKTKISNSWDYQITEGKTERLVSLCQQAGASEYISGPAAKDYIQARLFEESLIKLTWFNYDNYPEYPQLWGKFVHHVSIIDLLFNCGIEAPNYMRHVAN